jgi:hypothetical protein
MFAGGWLIDQWPPSERSEQRGITKRTVLLSHARRKLDFTQVSEASRNPSQRSQGLGSSARGLY